jgi:NAD(P)H-hydrate epimerase
LALQLSGGVILLKGVYDYIADSESYRVNLTGCAEMAVGGTGDVLAGLVVAFLSVGVSINNSACCSAYLNGKLGEEIRKNKGKRLLASDLIQELAPFLKSINL